jgi:transposase
VWQGEKAERQAELAEAKELLLEMTLRVKTLEERQSKDSHHSHLPPSSDRLARHKKTRSLRKRSGKKPGAQPGHEGHHLAWSDTPHEIVIHRVERCAHCQADLREVTAHAVERRQQVDVPPVQVQIREQQAERTCCPCGQQETRAPFPEEISAAVQYGKGVGAMAVWWLAQQLLPSGRTSQVLSALLGVRLSVGTLHRWVEHCGRALQPVERQIKQALRRSPVIHQDESGLYVQGKRAWMHVTATRRLTHYQVHANRGTAALDANGMLPGDQGTSVHDGWAASGGDGCQHALCNVHRLRELIFSEETTKQPWAKQMPTVLWELKALTEQAREAGLTRLDEAVITQARARSQAVLSLGEQANPPPIEKPKRGRRKQSAARNVLDRLTKHQDAVLAFLHDLRVPFDHSQAERDIRMGKVQQKGSGCFRRWQGSLDVCRIRGYLSTLNKQGLPLLSALQQT